MSRMADPGVAMQEWAVVALANSPELADALDIPQDQVGLRIWDSIPPPDADLPYILVQAVEPRDIGGVGMAEVMATGLLTAKVVHRAESYDPLVPVATALHQTLHGATNVTVSGGGLMLSSRRIRAISYPEQTQGVEYRHLGGLYEVSAQ